MNEDLAISLTILRAIRRVSQGDLAEAAGLSTSAISDYERGKVDPQTQTLRKLLRALGLPFSVLDLTQDFIHTIRAHVPPDVGSGELAAASAAPLSPEEREIRAEIAQIASEGGRFASRLTRLVLEAMAGRPTPGS